jgi:hypothetical protein
MPGDALTRRRFMAAESLVQHFAFAWRAGPQ